MPRSFTLASTAPHDFFLSLDVDSYFDHEHQPERIAAEGFTRPVPLSDHDVLMTIFFNGDPDNPKFTIESAENLTDSQIEEAKTVLKRILGTELPLAQLRTQAESDEKLGPLLDQFYGFRRLSRANFFEDAMNRLIQTQISHKPTARKMVYGVRNAYGTRLESKNGPVAAWPRPVQLIGADPHAMKAYGLSERKGEYVVGLANDIVSGTFPIDSIDTMDPIPFLETLSKVRGIGPTTAQDLMLYRTRPDAYFPPKIEKGVETGFRKWICYAYGADPEKTDDASFYSLIASWKGLEAMALEYFYLNWILREKRELAAKKRSK
jgi:3-methyladenine DNA glycosylase/8-oxoguanine DNA glycosylase